MQIHPVVASVVGKTSAGHWGQVLQTPQAYGVVEIAADDAIARQRGITVLSKLTHALSQGTPSLEAFGTIADEAMGEDVVSLVLLVPVGTVVYVVLRGVGAVYMRRGEKFATLLETHGTISGQVQAGDCLLACSRGFMASLTPEEVGGVFDHLSPAEVAEKLTLLLHEKQGGEGGAAIIFEAASIVAPEETPMREEASVNEASAAQKRAVPAIDIAAIVARAGSVLHRVVPQGRRWLGAHKRLVIPALLIGIFLLSVALGIRKQAGNAQGQKASAVIAEAQHTFDEGMALMDLNAVKGRERLSEAEQLLAPLVGSLSDRSADGRKAHELYAQITENIERAQRVTKVSPQVFYDVALVKKDAKVNAFAIDEGRMGLLDSAGRTVFDLTAASKNGQISGGGAEYTDASKISLNSDRLYVLVPGGVHMIRLSDRKTVPLVVKKDEGWGMIRSLIAYGGNLYLLDSQHSRIWKYVATETGFTERREYLNPDTLPDLSQGVSMAIDGSVWVGLADGRIMRFTQGKEQTFLLQGLASPLGHGIELDVKEGQDNIYVLDGEHKRVVVVDKDGVYVAQYVWEGEFSPTALAVSEESKLIFLLAAGKIYSIPME